jgi:hypothetical protein
MRTIGTLLLAMVTLTSCRFLLFAGDDTEAVPGCWMHRAVWTGKEMLVSCGRRFLRYDPAADSWAGVAPQYSVGTTRQEYESHDGHSVVWTGTELITWGGTVHKGNIYNPEEPPTGDGFRYNPATGDFRLISGLGAPEPRRRHTAVWTGAEMVVWGGESSTSQPPFGTGGRYDPKTDTWRGLSDTAAPAPRRDHAAVWTGTEMLVWGGRTDGGNTADGGRYDPATDSWASISASGRPRPRAYPGAVWDGAHLVVVGGLREPDGSSGPYAATYDPSNDTWTSLADPPNATYEEQYPNNEWFPALVWTGQGLVIWRSPGGARYDPVAWDKLSPQGEHLVVPPSGFVGMSGVWTGTEVIIWGGRPKDGGDDYRTGLRYNPATGAWRPTAVVMPDPGWE